MNTDRIEKLLEQLIAKQDDIVYRLEALESVVEEQLQESNDKLSSIQEELNWWEDKPSMAKQLLSALEHIEKSLNNIDISILSLDR